MSPDFDAIKRDILAGVPAKKIAKKYSRPVYEIGPDGKRVVSGTYGVITVEFLEGMAEQLCRKPGSSPDRGGR